MTNRSFDAAFMVPMAVSLAFGVLFATFITLILVPTAYVILEDIRHVMRRIFGRTAEVVSY
jgi:multidrug efflux pump subunit AcrB